MEEKYYIYKITNLVNGKVYIGETCTSVSDRFKRHLEKSSNCVKLKRAFNKYGKENFFAEQIDHAETQEEAFHKEAFWIEYYNSISNGYNVLPNRYCSNNKPPKKVYCLETKEVFDSVSSCARKYGTTISVIGNCCNGRKASFSAKHFCFIDEAGSPKTSIIKKVAPLKCKIKCQETGEVFGSIKEASQKYCVCPVIISQMLDGKRKTAAGLHWIRLDERRIRRKK